MNKELKIRSASAMLAAALAIVLAASHANADPVNMRTVMHYGLGAWVTPAAVVLRSAEEWTLWNDQMFAAQRAVAPELLPEGVDFKREILLVVAFGEYSQFNTLELARTGRTLYFTGRSEVGYSSGYPCHVVALDRRYADSIVLDPAIGTLESPFGAVTKRMAPNAADMTIATPPSSWGGVKHLYR